MRGLPPVAGNAVASWLRGSQLASILSEGGSRAVCYCNPKPCHAEACLPPKHLVFAVAVASAESRWPRAGLLSPVDNLAAEDRSTPPHDPAPTPSDKSNNRGIRCAVLSRLRQHCRTNHSADC